MDWFNCSPAHTQALNGNLKAYAAWYLWASLAGWDGITEVKSDEIVNNNFQLYQNHPNPFNPVTSLQYAIGSGQFVSLKVYDILGNEVATLVNEENPAGSYEVQFNAEGLSSGIYFYQLSARTPTGKTDAGFIETKKMLLIK